MKFIGRSSELSVLNRMYKKSSFQMMIIYGRRRVGKTTLLNIFSKDLNPLFYTGIESKDEENRMEFGREVFSYFNPDMKNEGGPVFDSYSQILAYITSSVKKTPSRRVVIILDEYPYMAENSRELASVLQREIDHEWSNLNIMLILCGSSITFMEEEVLGEKSPLYGRRTGQIDLLPLDYLDSSKFVPNYTPEEKALVYGAAGGIPKYLAEFDPTVSFEENLIDNFFTASGYFYEEPINLLRQEFRDVSLYFAILSAVGSGCAQVNEISQKTGFEPPKVSQALRRLEAVRIVKRDVPILNEKNHKLVQYTFWDNMFRFWFRFIPRGTGAIERNYGAQYYENMVRNHLHEYMGSVFEVICQEYVFQKSMSGKYDSMLTRVGKWRGNDPLKHCPSDIDVVGVNDAEKTAVIGECKFRNEQFDKKDYETFIDRGRLIAPYNVKEFLIFSISGVSSWVKTQLKEDNRVKNISLEQIFRT